LEQKPEKEKEKKRPLRWEKHNPASIDVVVRDNISFTLHTAHRL
jgi:hypothetical protein